MSAQHYGMCSVCLLDIKMKWSKSKRGKHIARHANAAEEKCAGSFQRQITEAALAARLASDRAHGRASERGALPLPLLPECPLCVGHVAAPARDVTEAALLAKAQLSLDGTRVYADWLIEHGDPRGEEIVTHLLCAPERKPPKQRKPRARPATPDQGVLPCGT